MIIYLNIPTNTFQINIDPESLKPKLPSRKDLKPYPITCYLEYRGHKGAVMSISLEASGQWMASGKDAILISFCRVVRFQGTSLLSNVGPIISFDL